MKMEKTIVLYAKMLHQFFIRQDQIFIKIVRLSDFIKCFMLKLFTYAFLFSSVFLKFFSKYII